MFGVKRNITANTLAIGGVFLSVGVGLLAFEPMIGYKILIFPVGLLLFAIGVGFVIGGCFDIVKTEKVLERWDDKVLRKTIKNADPMSQIHILQTWLPDKEDFCPFLEEMLIDGGKKFRVRVLLMDCCDTGTNKDLLCSRVLLRPESRQEACHQIESTISRLQQMKEHVDKTWEQLYMGAKLDLQIKLYNFMPFGPYYRIGNRASFVGLYLNSESSVHGPMMIVYNPQSRLWKKLEENFDKGWEASQSVTRKAGKPS